jgi:hypothetical protein
MKMNILIIDDIRAFNFERDIDNLVYARTVHDAIHNLASGVIWDEVWFDYDMGGTFGKLEIFDTSLPVLAWLAESIVYHHKKPRIERVYIHTSNMAGAMILGNTLQLWYDASVINPALWLAPRDQWADVVDSVNP